MVCVIENNVDSPNFLSSARVFFSKQMRLQMLQQYVLGERNISAERGRSAYESMRFLWNTFEAEFGFNDISANVD